MGLDATLFYFADIVFFVTYFIYKFAKRKLIFSCFNISQFTYFFSILISPVFYHVDEAWIALGVTKPADYYKYLDQTLTINSIGFIICTLTMAFVEFSKNKKGLSRLSKNANKINTELLDTLFWVFIIVWYFIVLLFNKGLPLFNGGRTFFLGSLVSPIYQALNQIILLYTLYYGTVCVYQTKTRFIDFIKIIVCFATLLFTGNRGTVIVNAFVPIALLFIIDRTKQKFNRPYSRARVIFSWRVHAFFKIIIILVVAFFVGLILVSIRSNTSFNLYAMFREIILGNTFSDMRDGAYILSGYDKLFGEQLLYGKTLIADILSFIPSAISPFMVEWRWGRFTTEMLFGMSDHFGLRGGNVMEAYLNFGVLGVIFFAAAQGVLNGFLEKAYYYNYYVKDNRGDSKSAGCTMLTLTCFSSLSNLITISSAVYNIYVCWIFFILICIPIRFRRKFRRKYIYKLHE